MPTHPDKKPGETRRPSRYNKQPHATMVEGKVIHWECYPDHLDTVLDTFYHELMCSVCLTIATMPMNWIGRVGTTYAIKENTNKLLAHADAQVVAGRAAKKRNARLSS